MDNEKSQYDEDDWAEISFLVDEARKYYNDNQYEDAIENYKRLLRFDQLDYKERAGLLSELGYCYHELALYDLSNKTLLTVEELNNDFENKSGLYRIIGANYFEIGDYSKAEKYQKSALEFSIDPAEKNILQFQLARTYLFAGNGKLAEKFFKKYLKALPDEFTEDKKDVFYNLGFTYLMLGKYAKAKECFQFLIDNEKNAEELARGYYGLIELYHQKQEYSEVKLLSEKIIDIYSDFSRIEKVHYYRILAYISDNEMDIANELVNKFLTHFPNSEYVEKIKQLLC